MKISSRIVEIQTEGKHCGDKCLLRSGSECMGEIMALEWDSEEKLYLRSANCITEEHAQKEQNGTRMNSEKTGGHRFQTMDRETSPLAPNLQDGVTWKK